MDFAIITPIAGLERYAALSKTHLTLSHIDDERYWDFYRKRKEAGDLIIMDNGSYERGFPSPHVSRMAWADIAVLPDFLLQPWQKTWHASIAFLDEYAGQMPDTKFLYIPQAEKGDLYGFLRSFYQAIEDPRISHIGIPRVLAYAITDNPLARVEFARLVRKERPDIRLHAFGMVNGDVHEIPYLAQAGVNSIDSSAPVWRGWNGFDIRDKSWDGKPVNFAAELYCASSRAEDLIMSNLEACNVRIPTR